MILCLLFVFYQKVKFTHNYLYISSWNDMCYNICYTSVIPFLNKIFLSNVFTLFSHATLLSICKKTLTSQITLKSTALILSINHARITARGLGTLPIQLSSATTDFCLCKRVKSRCLIYFFIILIVGLICMPKHVTDYSMLKCNRKN